MSWSLQIIPGEEGASCTTCAKSPCIASVIGNMAQSMANSVQHNYVAAVPEDKSAHGTIVMRCAGSYRPKEVEEPAVAMPAPECPQSGG